MEIYVKMTEEELDEFKKFKNKEYSFKTLADAIKAIVEPKIMTVQPDWGDPLGRPKHIKQYIYELDDYTDIIVNCRVDIL